MNKEIHKGLDFILLLSLLGSIIIFITASFQLSSNKQSTNRLFISWNKPLISNITMSSHDCSELNETTLFNYEWPGTVTGCDCTTPSLSMKFDYLGKLYKNKCSLNKTTAGCIDVEPTDKIKATKWRGNSICYEKFQHDNSYFDYIKVTREDLCPDSHKPCGVIDTLNNILCVPEHLNCPLNNFNLFPFYYPKEEYIKDNLTRIISEVRVSDGKHACANPDSDLFREEYELLNPHTRKGCSKSIDRRFGILDYYLKSSFYHDNNIASVIASLPKYPNIEEILIYLHGGVYVGWKDECNFVNDVHMFEKELNESLDSFSGNNFKLVFVIIVICILYFIGVIFFKYEQLDDNYLIRLDKVSTIYSIYALIMLFNFGIYMISYNIIGAIVTTDNSYNFFDMVGKKNCSDDLTNESLKKFSQFYFSNIDRYSQLKLLSGVSMLICISMVIVIYLSNLTRISTQHFIPVVSVNENCLADIELINKLENSQAQNLNLINEKNNKIETDKSKKDQ